MIFSECRFALFRIVLWQALPTICFSPEADFGNYPLSLQTTVGMRRGVPMSRPSSVDTVTVTALGCIISTTPPDVVPEAKFFPSELQGSGATALRRKEYGFRQH